MPATPPPLTTDDVAAIANLSRLRLTEAEVAQATAQLTNVLTHFAAIQQIDTASVPPADAVSGRVNIARPDEVAAEALCTSETLLAAAPVTANRQVKVPAIFE